jgi:peptide/nickel transport system substrate-binding protein
VLDAHRHARPWRGALAAVFTAALLTAACGGGGSGGGGAGGGSGAQFDAPPDEGTPKRGGKIVYGLEAETGGGWCLPNAQLAAGGIEVAMAIYDTLTAPASDGQGGVKFVPFLAESVEHNDTYDEWTIKVRDGITFHDGAPLTAEVVKQNLDAYLGKAEGIGAPLFSFVFENVTSVDVVDRLTVKVTTEVPWVAFDAYLFGSGRVGIMAPAQLADPSTCDRNLIGTGPFRVVNCEQEDCGWVVNDRFVAEANHDYWREDENGEELPYLDAIEFRPVVETAQAVNGLKGGELDVIHITDGHEIANLRRDAEAGTINLLESDFAPETTYTMLNASKPPFDNRNARLAFAHAVDVPEVIDITQGGLPERAEQPFGADNIAYDDPKDLAFPEHDQDKAKKFIDRYKQETGERELAFSILSTTETGTLKEAQLAQDRANAVGMRVALEQVEQTQIINTALAGEFQAVLWRNHPGGDPDTQYIWWVSHVENGGPGSNFVNFGRINDPDIDRIFTEGRSETDPATRAQIYKELPRIFARQAYNIWGWYTLWAFAGADDVHGLFPPTLPDGSEPVIIASFQPVVGIWRE